MCESGHQTFSRLRHLHTSHDLSVESLGVSSFKSFRASSADLMSSAGAVVYHEPSAFFGHSEQIDARLLASSCATGAPPLDSQSRTTAVPCAAVLMPATTPTTRAGRLLRAGAKKLGCTCGIGSAPRACWKATSSFPIVTGSVDRLCLAVTAGFASRCFLIASMEAFFPIMLAGLTQPVWGCGDCHPPPVGNAVSLIICFVLRPILCD